jgi:hypothetical protein
MGSFRLESLILKSFKIPKGGNQNPYIEEQQTTQWPKEKVQKTIYKTEMEFDIIILYLGVKMCKFYVCTICKQDISQYLSYEKNVTVGFDGFSSPAKIDTQRKLMNS